MSHPDRLSSTSPLPAPPSKSAVLPWLLFALLWGLSLVALVAGSQAAGALGS